jgi:hypothetical protein
MAANHWKIVLIAKQNLKLKILRTENHNRISQDCGLVIVPMKGSYRDDLFRILADKYDNLIGLVVLGREDGIGCYISQAWTF